MEQLKEVGQKVTFSFVEICGFTPDEDEQKKLEDLARRRDGVFYGSTEVYEKGLKTLKFVIEDEETGGIHHVNPLLVVFKK